MGGYDAQTFVGAMSTSTHGSGLGLGPLPDKVISLDLVAAGARVYRIEPSNGPTDPVKFNEKYQGKEAIQLIQDDDYFCSVICSMGSMGMIYSLTIEVRPKYWLKERRYVDYWTGIRKELEKGDILKENRHVDIYMSPYGNNLGIVSIRNEVDQPKYRSKDAMKRTFAEVLSGLPFTRFFANIAFKLSPNRAEKMLERALKALADGNYTDRSYKVLNLGKANNIKSMSTEIAVPMKDNLYLKAADKVIEMAKQRGAIGKQYLTSPMSLRFVKASKAYLSPQYDRDTCMIEVIGIKGSKGFFEVVQAIENEMYNFEARMHWGQTNFLNGDKVLLNKMYPQLQKWLTVFQDLNGQGKNTFHGPFTKRLGFG